MALQAGTKRSDSLAKDLQGDGNIGTIRAFFVIVMLQTATTRIAVAFSARTARLTDGFYFDMIISADAQDTPVAACYDPCYQEEAKYGGKRCS